MQKNVYGGNWNRGENVNILMGKSDRREISQKISSYAGTPGYRPH